MFLEGIRSLTLGWSVDDVLQKLLKGRAAIRYHRDQRGDDRCFLDDYIVWAELPDALQMFTMLPLFEDAMRLCRVFYCFRSAKEADAMRDDAITDRARWDEDVIGNCKEELLAKLVVLYEAIRVHRDIVDRPRTTDDDRVLYSVLPEKLPADFCLPSEDEFLGEVCAPKAGCPAFWRSHADCFRSVHDFHHWGPC